MKDIFQPAQSWIIPTSGVEVTNESSEMTIRFDFEMIPPVEGEEPKPQQCSCEMVRVPRNADYGTIVAAIITDKYNNDSMQAIVNNYLDAPEEQTYLEAFTEMQSWRRHAKNIASIVLQ